MTFAGIDMLVFVLCVLAITIIVARNHRRRP